MACIKKYFFISVAVVFLALACLGLGVIPVNLFFIKTTLSDTAREQWGVELLVEGPLKLRLGFDPALSAADITLSSPDHGLVDPVEVDRLTVKPGLINLIRGHLDLRKIQASGIKIESGSAMASEIFPEVFQLWASAPVNGPLQVEISGQRDHETLKLAASGASLGALLDGPEEYPLTLELEGFSARLHVEGSIREPLKAPQLAAQVDLEVQNLSVLFSNFNLPPTELHSLSVQSGVFAGNDQIRLEALTGTLDETAFQMSGLARPFQARPWLEIDLSLAELDVLKLTDTSSRDTPSQTPTDFNTLFDVLSGFDGRISLAIGRLVNIPVNAEQLEINARLDDRRLLVDHAGLMVEASRLTAEAALDMSVDCEQLDSTFELSGFDLEILNRFLDENSDWGGGVGSARVVSGSCGASLDDHLRSLRTRAVFEDLRPRHADQALQLNLRRLEAAVNWNEPGHLSFDGDLLGKNLSVAADFGPVETLLQNEPYPFSLSADSTKSSVSLEGTGVFMNDQPGLDVIVSVDVSAMGSLHAWLGTAPENQLPFRGRVHIQLDENGFVVDELDAVLGNSDLRGDLSWPGPDRNLPTATRLVSSRLDLEEIAGLFPEADTPGEDKLLEWSDLFDGNEWVERWFRLPSIDIDFSAAQIHNPGFDFQGAHFRAKFRDRLIENGQLNFQLEDILIAATLDLDLREEPYSIDGTSVLNQIDIGRLMSALDLADDIDAQADSAVIHYESEGRSLREIALSSRLEARIENLHLGLDAGPEKRRFDFDLSELELLARPLSKTIWRTSGSLNGSAVKAWMQTPSLPDTFEPDASLPLTLVIGAGKEIAMLDLVLEHLSETDLQAVLELSGAMMDPAATDFSTLRSPLQDYVIKTQINIDDSAYRISDFNARIGSSELSGELSVTGARESYRFDAEVNSPFLETDDFVKWTEAYRRAKNARKQENLAVDGGEIVDEGLLTLVERYFDEFAGDNHYRLKADFGEVRSSGSLLGQGKLELLIDDTGVLLDPVMFILPGGKVEGYYRGTKTSAGYEYVFDMDIDKLNYGGLLQLLDPASQARGTAFLDVDLVSRTPTPDQFSSNLTGTVDMAMFPEDAAAGFLDLWASNLVLTLLTAAGDSNKQLNCLVARYEVKDGIMTSKETFLDSTDIIVWARGEIDLGRRQLDLLFAPQAKVEKFLSISAPIQVIGPFDDFQAGVAPGGFLTTMFRWYMSLIYVPWKWLTGQRFPPDGIATCFNAMDWEVPEASR